MSTKVPDWGDPTAGDALADTSLSSPSATSSSTTAGSPISESGQQAPRSMTARATTATMSVSAGSASAGGPSGNPTTAVPSGGAGASTAASRAGGSASAGGRARPRGPRRVRLTVARVDPWSVMKLSFLLSVAAGIASVVLTAVLWMVLSSMGVFDDIDGVLASLQSTTAEPFSIKDYVGFSRVGALSIVIAILNVFLMTAIATVMAFLYNICSALVGGLQLTLTDD